MRSIVFYASILVATSAIVAWSIPIQRSPLIKIRGPHGQYGLINTKGRVATSTDYNAIGEPGPMGWRIALRDKSVSIIDPAGKERRTLPGIQVKFYNDDRMVEEIAKFNSKGLCRFEKNGSSGWINRDGDIAIPAIYDEAEDFSESGLAKVRNPNRYWGLIDQSGREVIPPEWDEINDFDDEGMALVKRDGMFGWINKTNQVVIDLRWKDASEFDSAGMAAVSSGLKWGWIDRKGEYVIPPRWNYVGTFDSHDLAEVEIDVEGSTHRVCGWINRLGEVVIEPAWCPLVTSEPLPVGSHFRMFTQNTPSAFDDSGMVIIFKEGKFGWLGTDGKVAIPPSWNWATSFDSHGVARVTGDDSVMIIDRSGEVLVATEGQFCFPFDSAGRAEVVKNGPPKYSPVGTYPRSLVGWIDRKGDMIRPAQEGNWMATTQMGDPAGFYTAEVEMSATWLDIVARIFHSHSNLEEGTKILCHCYDVNGKLIWSSDWIAFETKCGLVAFAAISVAFFCRPRRRSAILRQKAN